MELLPHVAFAIVALSFAVRDIFWLRCFAVLASAIMIGYEAQRWLSGQEYRLANVLWHSLFVSINVARIWLIVYGEKRVRFTADEQVLYDTIFRQFTKLEFMKLLRLARWREAAPGEVLVRRSESLQEVMLLFSGVAEAEAGGRTIARLRDGQFIGEMSFLTDSPASTTVRAVEPTRYLTWPRDELSRLLRHNPSLHFALQQVMGVDMTRKLRGDGD